MNGSDREQIHALSQRILINCAHRLGGSAALARHLGVGEDTLADWLSGERVPPVDVIMKAIAPLVGNGTATRASQEPPATRASGADVA